MNKGFSLGKMGFSITALAAALALSMPAQAIPVKVTVTSLAPVNGVEFTPVWVGFHDGGFDTFDTGGQASVALERLAEDGNPGPISVAFSTAGYTHQGVIFSPGGALPPIFEAGETNVMFFDLDGNDINNRYFSLLSMIVPSNDAFFGNPNPVGHRIFNDDGTFKGDTITVTGKGVRDAGTEVNDEMASTTARFAQMLADTGTVENGAIGAHPGFIPGGRILSNFVNADFTQTGYQIARIKIEAVPEPATVALMMGGLGMLGFSARKRRTNALPA